MTSINMDGLVPHPFPTIDADDDARALMAQINKALTTAEAALYKADTFVAVLNDTDDYRAKWLPWNQGRNLRMRVQQAIDAVVTAQAMHAPYPVRRNRQEGAHAPYPMSVSAGEPSGAVSEGKEAEDRLLTRSEVAQRYGCSVRTMIRMDKSGDGPTPVRIGPRMIRYRESEVALYLDANGISVTAAGA